MKLQEVDLRNVYRIWKSNLGPFRGFFRSTPFVSLQTYDDFNLEKENRIEYNPQTLNIIMEKFQEDNFLIIDLPLNEIINLSLVLNNEYSIKPILNINLLFHPFGVVGTKDNINKLINNGFELKNINTNKFIMMIPYDRYDENIDAEELKNKLNNQYGIGEDDLPYVNMLKDLGYSQVIIITKDNIKEDLSDYVNYISKDIRAEIIKVM
ncbi:normocyte-binding protein [Clostridium sp. C2-6-12]|uniref:normocyte-binding protein n=1 Tax=Clostridium sp. C2-6-12 TaxID=2698832 RepID=UPI00136D1D87|nr:normocyte-binding protein [Clostridium sp. C2-6-12]